jgi:hypothetical protein
LNSQPNLDPQLLELPSSKAQSSKYCFFNKSSYRLGVPGFLTSSELRDAGYQANNGLHDQRTALKWVKKYIQGFGGDPDRITVIGQSAGGVAVTLHFYSQEPLFNQAICIGGTHLMMPPVPQEVQEHVYRSVVDTLQLGDLSPEERINHLLTIPAKDIYSKFGFGLPLLPAVDSQLFTHVESFAQIVKKDEDAQKRMPGKVWCKSLLIGDAQFDVSGCIRTKALY